MIYALGGFLILPMVLARKLPEKVGALLGRQVTVTRVRTNPFTLSITIDGFQVKDPDGAALMAWDRLHVNAELWPLIQKRLAFKVIDLERPRLRVVIEKGGRLNFSDIVDRLSASEAPAKPAPAAEASEPMEVAIERLRVGGAELAFLDRSLAEPFASTLGPVTIGLERFRTARDASSPYAFKGRTEAGEAFAWKGTVGTQPLRSAGSFELTGLRLPKYAPYYQSALAFELPQGTLTARADYTFEWSTARHVMQLVNGTASLKDLALREKGRETPSLRFPDIQVDGVQADALASSVDIASVTLQDGELDVRRDKDGSLNLQTMFTPPPAPADQEPSNLKLHVGQVVLKNHRLRVEDQVPARAVALDLHAIQGSIKDVNLEPEHTSPIELSLRLGESGSLTANGTVAPLKPAAKLDIKLEGLDLPPFDPYLDAFADMRISRGRLGIAGRLAFSAEGKRSDALTYSGDLQVSQFEARDALLNEPFLRWKNVRLAGIAFDSTRPSVKLKNVVWAEPEGRMVIASNGVSNVARALRLTTPSGPAAAIVPPSPVAASAQPLVHIAQMRIAGGRLSFIDRSLEPNAALLLSEMEGTYTGLSTEAEEATLADFRGKAGGTAPIVIHGKAMPLRHDKDTDVTIKISGADLTDFSPYTGKYLGYTTRQGKLDVDARVRIQERRLNIEDKVRLDRMYLGDKVDSPDATHLPVKLGLAILRDRKGVIELDVPIDGSLDDPDIHYGKMVWKAIFNVLGKIITSPFSLLSKMFGGGEDLSHIAFAPGSVTLGPAEQKKLETLIKALVERPELRLEIEATADGEDTVFLKQQGLDNLLRRLKWTAKKVKVPATVEEEVIEPGERETWLRAAFNTAFPAPKDAVVEPPPLAELEQRMLDTIQLDPEKLQQLTEGRNRAVIEGLMKDGQLESTRVFEVRGSEAARAGGPRLYFSLK